MRPSAPQALESWLSDSGSVSNKYITDHDGIRGLVNNVLAGPKKFGVALVRKSEAPKAARSRHRTEGVEVE